MQRLLRVGALLPRPVRSKAPRLKAAVQGNQAATFVPAAEIDPLYFDATYWLHPGGSAVVEPCRVITAAMEHLEMGSPQLSRRAGSI